MNYIHGLFFVHTRFRLINKPHLHNHDMDKRLHSLALVSNFICDDFAVADNSSSTVGLTFKLH